MTTSIRLLVCGATVAVAAALSACAPTPATTGTAEARLRVGVLPSSVPAAPPGGALAVAQDHFRTGNFGYAARYYEQAIAEGEDGAEAWLGLAAAYDRLRRFDLADRAYLEAARTAGGTSAYHNNVGFSYLLRGDRDKAARSLARALDLAPGSPVVQNNLELLREAGGGGSPRA